MNALVCIFQFQLWIISKDTSFSDSYFLHVVWSFLVLLMLLKIALFNFVFWRSQVSLCTWVSLSLSIYLSISNVLAFSECKPVHTLVACAFSKHCLLKFPQSGSAGSYNNSISISLRQFLFPLHTVSIFHVLPLHVVASFLPHRIFIMAFHSGAEWSLAVLLTCMPLTNPDIQHVYIGGLFFLNNVMRIYRWIYSS